LPSLPDDLPPALRDKLAELTAGAELMALTISPDGASLHLRLLVDGQPFLHVYERTADGEYKLVGAHTLGQSKF
jgi:hypothetical protein